MSQVHPNVEVFRRTYDAFTSGDMAKLAEFFAEDVVWHTPGDNLVAGDFHGREATFAAFGREFELSNGTYQPAIRDVLANDNHTVALMHVTAERDDKKLDMDYVLVFDLRDGQIVEGRGLWTDQAAYDEFWS